MSKFIVFLWIEKLKTLNQKQSVMRKILPLILCLAAMLGSCSKDEIFVEQNSAPSESAIVKVNPEAVVPGVVYVELKPGALTRAEGETRSFMTEATAPSPIRRTLESVGAMHMRSIIPFKTRYENSIREYGLDRWFKIYVAPDADLAEVFMTLQSDENVESVSLQPRKRTFATYVPAVCSNIPSAVTEEDGKPFFNDPMLSKQWHYDNNLQGKRYENGYDINAIKAWKQETGRPDVIVGVVDGGIDVVHPDLLPNLWVNTKEIPGDGIDNDGNGIVDDIYGVNTTSVEFVKENGKWVRKTWKDKAGNEVFAHGNITVDGDGKGGITGHGTHVAGTIAAKNNNGIGVCGIAGGDGSENSGIRMISCEIFGKDNEGYGDDITAFMYALENGAVILNNSWGYVLEYDEYNNPKFDEYPKITAPFVKKMKQLIQLFNDKAGCDDSGNQLPDSPMKGGLCIFAAGNDPYEFESLPAALDNVVAVAAAAPDWKITSYSTYGKWVDITAPGGEFAWGTKKYEVYSTLPVEKTGDAARAYGYMAGTSMATPHVTGIAALLVSKHGGQGFTRDDAERILLSSIYDKSFKDANKPKKYEGKMGVGYIDANMAVEVNNGEPLKKVEVEYDVFGNYVELGWKNVERACKYLVSCEDLISGKEISNDEIPVNGVKVGELISHKIEKLEVNKKYKVEVTAFDRFGNKSEAAAVTFETSNQNPVIEMPEEVAGIKVNNHFPAIFSIKVTDADGDKITLTTEGDTEGVTHSEIGEGGMVTVTVAPEAVKADVKRKMTFKAVDNFGGICKKELAYEVLRYEAPAVTRKLEPIIISKKEKSVNVSLEGLFSYDRLARNVKMSVSSDDKKVASVAVMNKEMTVKAGSLGKTRAVVMFSDGSKGGDIETSADVYVVSSKDDAVYMMYPEKAEGELNFMVNPSVEKASVSIRSALGARVYEATFSRKEKFEVSTISLKDFVPGAYTLIVETAKGKFKKMFVKL